MSSQIDADALLRKIGLMSVQIDNLIQQIQSLTKERDELLRGKEEKPDAK